MWYTSSIAFVMRVCLTLYRRKRSLLAQFRMGVLPLAIETGRFKGIKLNERLCKFCNSQDIEDEKHMLCKCNLYDDARSIMYSKASDKCENFNVFNDDEKLVYLLSQEWKLVADFLDNAWTIRSNKLYVDR